MNTDTEFSCSMFHEHLRAYIDNELPVNRRAQFLEHRDVCERCARELRDMQRMRDTLGGLRRVTVSPEFDFAMKTRIRREHEQIQQPFYGLRLMARDNISRLMAVPVAAALLLSAFALYQVLPSRMGSGLPMEVERQIRDGQSVELVQDGSAHRAETVRYVLEKVSPQDIEGGVIITGYGQGESNVAPGADITLISF